VKTLVEHLPKLCEAMCHGECYKCKDDVFRLQSTVPAVLPECTKTRYSLLLKLSIYVT
jgi:hypothetical protein